MQTSLPQLDRRTFEQLVMGAALMSMSRSGSANPAVKNDALTLANNQFAIQFLQNIESFKPGENQIVSPFSIESALLMTMEGARGKTSEEMGTTLGLPKSLKRGGGVPWDLTSIRNEMKAILEGFYRVDVSGDQKLRQRLANLRRELSQANDKANELMRAGKHQNASSVSRTANTLADQVNLLSKSVDRYELRIANSIWAEKTFPIEVDYKNTLNEFYGAAIENVDFKHAAETQRVRINKWVSEHTEKKINDLIQPGVLDSLTRMVLANAIYFRGTWQEPFTESQTKQKQFFNRGVAESQVATMSKYFESGRYAAFHGDGSEFATPTTLPEGASPDQGYPTDGFQAVELPYNGDDMSMLVLLPRQRDGLGKLISLLAADRIPAWDLALQARDFNIELPKFKLEVAYDLNETLKRQGINDAFNPNAADFSGISPEGIFISKVVHKAFVEVNEKGTEAAAATAVVMTRASAVRELPFVPNFFADHPFLFLIRNRHTGLILFLGKVETLPKSSQP